MDRKQAIAEMEKLRELMLFDAMTGEDIPYEALIQENKNLYDAAGVAIQVMKRSWIPVTESKPEMHEEVFEDFEETVAYQVSDWVLCMDSDGDCEVAHLTECQGEECWVTRDGAETDVVRWMEIRKEKA